MSIIKKEVVKYLRDRADMIEAENSNITEDEGILILSTIAHIELSKELTCDYLNVRRSLLNNLIAKGKIPEGRKVKGFKELRWYLDELLLAIHLRNKLHV